MLNVFEGVSLDFCFWDEIGVPPEVDTIIGDADASSSASPTLGRLPSALVNIFGSRGEIKGSIGVFPSTFPSAFFDFDEEKKFVASVRGELRGASEGTCVAMIE